jgi:hypothetical protein
MKIQWQLISVNRRRPRESQTERRGNTRVGNLKRRRKPGKKRRGEERTSGIGRGERGS